MLDQVGQARVDGVDVQVEALLGQPLRDLGGGLVRQQTRDLTGERAHDRDVGGRLLTLTA